MTCSDNVVNTVTQEYNDCTPPQLRTALRKPKSAKGDQIDKIRCVSRLLRRKIKAKKCSSTDPHAADSLEGRVKNFFGKCAGMFSKMSFRLLRHSTSHRVQNTSTVFCGESMLLEDLKCQRGFQWYQPPLYHFM